MEFWRRDVRLPNFPVGQTIPRILHQHFLGGDAAIPDHIRVIRDALREANPGWTYSFWDNPRAEAWITDMYGRDVLDRYLRIRPEYYAARSDLLRYLNLYALGGVYLDIKSTCDRTLNEAILPEDKFLIFNFSLAEQEMRQPLPELAAFPNQEYVQWVMGTVKGHPYLRAVIERVLANIDSYCPRRHSVGGLATRRLTGPVPFSLEIEAIRDRYPHSGPMFSQDRGFVYSALSDNLDHRDLFGESQTHYAELRAPIVLLSPLARFSLMAREALSKIPIARFLARRARTLLRGARVK